MIDFIRRKGPEMKYKVLFIEDNPIDQKAFQQLVDRENLPYDYTVVSSVGDAMDLMSKTSFDIILADYMTGGGSAFELFSEIDDTPVILVTGAGDEEVAVQAMKYGVRDYIIKDKEKNYLKILPITISNAIKHCNEERLFKLLWHAIRDITDSVYCTDMDERIIFVNEAFCRTYGYTENEIIGQTAEILWDIKAVEYLKDSHFQRTIKGSIKGEYVHKKKDGNTFPVLLSQSVIRDENKKEVAVAGIVRDITERKIIEEQFQSLAHFDALTSLPNRAYLLERLNSAIIQARWNNSQVAFLFLDLDHFKNINDILGHEAGDRMLKEVAQRLKQCIRDSDTVARMGGDEFTIILPKLNKTLDSTTIAQRIIESLSRSFHLDGYECSIGVSIGISQFPEDGEDAESLVRNADMAMYKAKEFGGNNYQFFTSSMGIAAFDRLIMENKIRKGLEKDQFHICFQPRINLSSKKINGVEALIHWRESEDKILTPKEFTPMAEETGLVIPIGKWLIKNACRQNKEWQKAGLLPITIAVNISSKLLKQPDFCEMILKEMNESGLAPEYLEMELSENALHDIMLSTSYLNNFCDLGVKISIADFGSGFTSLRYLKNLPIYKIKIDKSFIKGIEKSKSDREIIKAIINMAHSMDIKVIAEGVENASQLEFLQSHDCDEAQGFYLSAPISSEDIFEMMKELRPDQIVNLWEMLGQTS
jgi:diguanylate cyclase (GGDEF)-like protein/PAS domain S-box-containing protein